MGGGGSKPERINTSKNARVKPDESPKRSPKADKHVTVPDKSSSPKPERKTSPIKKWPISPDPGYHRRRKECLEQTGASSQVCRHANYIMPIQSYIWYHISYIHVVRAIRAVCDETRGGQFYIID